MNVAQCRVFDEVIFIGYCKVKKLRSLLNLDVFLMKFEKNLNTSGVSKFEMVLKGPNVGGGMNASPIFK